MPQAVMTCHAPQASSADSEGLHGLAREVAVKGEARAVQHRGGLSVDRQSAPAQQGGGGDEAGAGGTEPQDAVGQLQKARRPGRQRLVRRSVRDRSTKKNTTKAQTRPMADAAPCTAERKAEIRLDGRGDGMCRL